MDELYTAKEDAKSNLEQAVRDFIAAAAEYGDDDGDIREGIRDAVCDGSDRKIIFP